MGRQKYEGPISVWDQLAVRELFGYNGVKEIHAQTLHVHLCRHPSHSLLDVPGMPQKYYDLARANKIVQFTSKVVRRQQSSDGTCKLLLELWDGLRVEAVVMLYDPSKSKNAQCGPGTERYTLCVSSQVGCQMGCTFCATGTMGLSGNLQAFEIIEQLAWANREAGGVRNIVFMGMGEPLANFDNVRDAIRFMVHPSFFCLSPKRVTVSTVGVIPGIRRLARELPSVSLALSLHAPTQDLRETIVPSAKAFKLDKLMEAIDNYIRDTGNKIFVEYVLLHGVNDGEKEIRELGELLKSRRMHVTLNGIPWNPVLASPGIVFAAPPPGHAEGWKRTLMEDYGVNTTLRQEKGQDISGACGQLVVSDKLGDIEDLATGPKLTSGLGVQGLVGATGCA